jgi:hypothetical protein
MAVHAPHSSSASRTAKGGLSSSPHRSIRALLSSAALVGARTRLSFPLLVPSFYKYSNTNKTNAEKKAHRYWLVDDHVSF